MDNREQAPRSTPRCNVVLSDLEDAQEAYLRKGLQILDGVTCIVQSAAPGRAVAAALARALDEPGTSLLVAELSTEGRSHDLAGIVRLHRAYPQLAMIVLADALEYLDAELRATLGADHRILLLARSHRTFEFQQLVRAVIRSARQPTRPSALPALTDEADTGQSRWTFERDVAQALRESIVVGKHSALCIFGIDRFHAMLDRFGAAAQSSIVRQVRRCIQEAMQGRYRLLRVGDDEFGVLLLDTSAREACALAESVIGEVRKAGLHWRGVGIPLTASAGVTDTSCKETQVTELLLAADTALQAAWSSGGDRVRAYHNDDSVLVQLKEQSTALSEIEAALAVGRFRMFAQLIVPTAPEEAVSAEILLRMVDGSGRQIVPAKFLPAAERFGIAPRIDRWVVDHALQQLSSWRGIPGLGHLSINLSGRTLMDSASLEWIETRFRQAALPPGSVCFEITETAVIDRWSVAAPFVDRLRALGALFSLDDFGAGFASFTYLESVPADFLKIDGSFVKECTSDPRRLALLRSLNEIGHLFGKRTVAEFVENDEILRAVSDVGVNYAQGYFSGVPFALEYLAEKIAGYERRQLVSPS